MKQILYSAFVVLWSFAWQLFATVPSTDWIQQAERCSPGEGGPKPLSDISIGEVPGPDWIKTNGGVQEFVLSPHSETLFYRNESSEIYRMDSQTKSESLVSRAGGPLSPVFDSAEKYLLNLEGGFAFNLRLNSWIRFLDTTEPLKHLFWEKDFWGRDWIYSLSKEESFAGNTYHLYRSSPDADSGAEVCTIRNAQLASGHTFPQVFFYQTRETSKGPLLSLLKLDVRHCHFTIQTNFLDPIVGKVLSVHQFEQINSMAVQVDHPTKNFLWYRIANGCDYYDVGSNPVVPNPQLPVLTTWSKKTGLQVIYLQSEKRATYLTGAPFEELLHRDVALSKDAHRLFLSPRLEGEKFKSLGQLKLN